MLGDPRRKGRPELEVRQGLAEGQDSSSLTLSFSTESVQAIYVASGEPVEMPCPSPPSLPGGQLLTWFRSPVAGSSTILVARVQVDRPASDLQKAEPDSRVKVLGNYSLLLEGSRDEDAGRYWCTVMDQNHKYQNWRVYDISVLKGELGSEDCSGRWRLGKPHKKLRSPCLSPARVPVLCEVSRWPLLHCPPVLCGPCQAPGLRDLARGKESRERTGSVLLGRRGRPARGVPYRGPS